MRAALISVSDRGADLTARISDLKLFDCLRFAHESHCDAVAVPFSSVCDLTRELFSEYDALIYVCAAGIAVRSVAPCICSKQTDPAVLVIDENCRFIIPILSGHIGGANALAEILAEYTHAQAVLTTATDSGKRFSPDSFAVANSLRIADFSAAKQIAAAVLCGEPIGLVSDFPYVHCPTELYPDKDCRTGICISFDKTKKPFPITLLLIPRDLVLGIGCRRNATAEQIEAQVQKAAVPMERVCRVATIDRKKNEPGLVRFCREHHLKLVYFSAEELRNVSGSFHTSAFVQQTVDVDNVCERSAVLSAGGKLIFPKCSGNGVTCAAAQRDICIDFSARRDFS